MSVTTTIPWGDGSGDNLYFTADAMEGNQEVLVSSDANAGAERSKTVTFSAQGAEPKSLGIIQLRGGSPDDWKKDGETYLWLNILTDSQKYQELRVRFTGTIDWGDGDTTTVSTNSYTTHSHTYSDTGKYVITIYATSGAFMLGGNNTSYNLMGSRTDANAHRQSALYQVEIGTKRINAITQMAFYYLYGLERVYIPKSVTNIGAYSFSYCLSLRHLEFEDASTNIDTSPSYTFENCYSLQYVGGNIFPAATSYSNNFKNCYTLGEAVVPSTTTSIGANTFGNTKSLQHLYVYAATPPTVANANAFTGINSGCVIHVPNGKLTAYQAADKWSTYSSQMVEMPA